jgi:hypothetical protein
MIYDPRIEYGQMDLSIAENLSFWKFSELIKNLIILSSDAQKQIELSGFGDVADEMAIDFGTYYTLSLQSYLNFNLITIEQKQELDELDKYLDDRSGDKNPDFWDDSKLDINPEWELIRLKAKKILKLMNKDDLAIKYVKTEKIDDSGKFVSQTMKTRLIYKNSQQLKSE